MQNYFTFPDRSLVYDCGPCLACCGGLGIGVDASTAELPRLLELEPELSSFARLRGDTWTFANPRGGCYFLESNGFCRLEREHGRALKPAACRLFPVNRVFLVGAVRVIDYNAVICPLRLEPGATGAVDHADLVAEIEAVRDPAVVGSTLALVDADAFFARERRIAEACFELEPADESRMAALFAEQFGHAVVLPRVALEEVLGRALRWPSGPTLRNALLATPSLRFNERFARRSFPPELEREPLLACIWLVWLRLAADAEALARAPLSLQALTGLWAEALLPGFFVGAWEQRLKMGPGRVELAGQGPVQQRLLSLAQGLAENGRAQKTLGELFERLLELPAHQRMAAVRGFDALLGRLELLGRPSSPRSLARRK